MIHQDRTLHDRTRHDMAVTIQDKAGEKVYVEEVMSQLPECIRRSMRHACSSALPTCMLCVSQSGSSMRLNDFACVWWDFAVQDWSITGCKKVWSSTGRTCQCEASQHLANFAMLMVRSSSSHHIHCV